MVCSHRNYYEDPRVPYGDYDSLRKGMELYNGADS
jgi:hypothetical protein